MKILLTGAAGQLGQELQPLLGKLGEVTSVDRQFQERLSALHLQQDLSDLNRVEILLNRVQPDLVVNACAYTAVDSAEKESSIAFRLNADLPGCLARWSQRNGALLLHYSTDYVFDGQNGQPYCEEDKPGPLNVYGESKLAGEWAIEASHCRNIVLRTSWVYSGHGKNFVLSMLRLARERPALQIVKDQTGCPTWARNLATVSSDVIKQLLRHKQETSLDGLYHYCDETITTWYDFARLIFTTGESLGLLEKSPETTPVNSSEYPQAAQRPARSVLDTALIKKTFAVEPPGLNESLAACLQELQKND
jgi:dTDP-4-dehydrorhamnose reductase